MTKVRADLDLNVFDALYSNPLAALVALAFLDDGFLELTWFGAFGVPEGSGRRKGTACRCRDTYEEVEFKHQ
jgi:hypothetical protein